MKGGLFLEDYAKWLTRKAGEPLPEVIRHHPGASADEIQCRNMLKLYYDSGQQMVKISEDMYELLLRTDLKGITPQDLKLPYPCLGFIMPRLHHIDVARSLPLMPTKTVYLRSRQPGEIPSEISAKLGLMHAHVMDPREVKRLMKEKGVTQEDIDESLSLGFLVFVGAMHGANAATTWVGFGKDELDKASRGSTIEDVIRKKVGTVEQVVNNRACRAAKKRVGDDFFDMMKVAMNAVVYLNHGLDSKLIQRRDDKGYREYTRLYATTNSESKKRTYGRKVTRIARPTVRLLGPNIKRGTLGPQSATDVLVRGHWHTYWTGKGRTTRKLNWVQPYMRGRDKGVTPSDDPRLYQL